MKISEIREVGLRDFIKDLLAIDKEFASHGKSSGEGDVLQRVRLTDKASYILKQVKVDFILTELTLPDIDVIKSFCSNMYINKYVANKGRYAIDKEHENEIPDVFTAMKETVASSHTIEATNKDAAHYILPIGVYKYSARASFSGNALINLANGFLENSIYNIFNSDDFEANLKYLYGEFVLSFMNKYHKGYELNVMKKGLIEDYLMDKYYFSYMKDEVGVKIAKVEYPDGIINFLGATSESLNEDISKFRKRFDDNIYEYMRYSKIYFIISSHLPTYYILKNMTECTDVVAEIPRQIVLNEIPAIKISTNEIPIIGARINSSVANIVSAIKAIENSDKYRHQVYIDNLQMCGKHNTYLMTFPLSPEKPISVEGPTMFDETREIFTTISKQIELVRDQLCQLPKVSV